MRPAPALDQVGHRQADQPGVGGEVDVERVRPVALELVLGLERRVDHRDTGVVDDDVESARPAHGPLDQSVQLGEVADVAHHADAPSPGRAPRRSRRRPRPPDRRQVGNHDARPLVSEQERGRPAHAARRAGDDGGVSGDRPGQLAESCLRGVGGVGHGAPFGRDRSSTVRYGPADPPIERTPQRYVWTVAGRTS